MSKFKKFFSLALVAALTFTMNMTTFAATSKPDESERPVNSVDVNSDFTGTSITVGTVKASFEKDVNYGNVTEDQVYARAELSGATEYDLRNETVTITTDSSVDAITCEGKTAGAGNITFSGSNGEFPATNVDLFNNYYDLVIGNKTVRLAAGLPAGKVDNPTPDNDSLKVNDLSFGNVSVPLTATNTANEFYGNDYYEYPDEKWDWTSIVYQFKTEKEIPSNVGTMTVAKDATLTGCVAGVGTGASASYTFSLNGANPSFIVTDSKGNTRTYYVSATVASDEISVTYAINLSEVVNDSTYASTFAKNCTEILNGAEGYFEAIEATDIVKTNDSVSAVITVPAGTNAMQPMLDLTEWATSEKIFTGTTKNNGTYLATLDGLGEFSCGQMSGWMYTDDSEGYSPNVTGPGVGAASYTMTNGQKITWYMTTNYFNHF